MMIARCSTYLSAEAQDECGECVNVRHVVVNQQRQSDEIAIVIDLNVEVLFQHGCSCAQQLHNVLQPIRIR